LKIILYGDAPLDFSRGACHECLFGLVITHSSYHHKVCTLSHVTLWPIAASVLSSQYHYSMIPLRPKTFVPSRCNDPLWSDHHRRNLAFFNTNHHSIYHNRYGEGCPVEHDYIIELK